MIRTALIVVVVLTALPGVARSQVPGIPNFHHPNHNGEPSAHLDFGHGFADVDNLDVLQVRVTHGTDRFTGRVIWARLFNSAGQNEFAAAVNGSFNLYGGKSTKFFVWDVQAGAGLFSSGLTGAEIDQVDVPVGLAVGIQVPHPLGTPHLWIAPRLHLRRRSMNVMGASASDWETGHGVALGFAFTCVCDLEGHIAYEYLKIDDPLTGTPLTERSIGLSVGYRK